MTNLILGILLVVGIAATATSAHTVFYGAMLVGIINVFRGLSQLGSCPGQSDDHHTTW